MPQVPSNGPPPKRSEDRPKTPHSGGSSGIFTAELPDQTARNGRSRPCSPPDLSAEITEPFPEGFVRMPIPDAVFSAMAGLSDSALRSLLGLIRLSFRFDPEDGQWVCPDRTFSRADVQTECGLSGQGTRNGLSELESEGYVSIDRSGRSYEHTLEIGVPSSCFTYVPTGLLEEAPGLAGTELRLVMAVLRTTWGWTETTGDGEAPEHRRWAQLSTRALSGLTGRSESAVKTAVRELQGTWLQRRRPTSGAYHFRFRSEVLTTETAPEEEASTPGEVAVHRKRKAFLSMGIPNDLAPDRQRSGPPRRRSIEKKLETQAKHSARSIGPREAQEELTSSDRDSAVHGKNLFSSGSPPGPGSQNQRREPESEQSSHRGPREGGRDNADEIDLTGFSDRKRQLGQKLANAGVWARRIPELLGRYSAERIEANFQLYRKRAHQVQNGGAWLAAAIEGGYALPSPPEESPSEAPLGPSESTSQQAKPDVPPGSSGRQTDLTLPKPGSRVSETRKQKLVGEGLASEEDFDRFKIYNDPTQKQHFYRPENPPPRVRASAVPTP